MRGKKIRNTSSLNITEIHFLSGLIRTVSVSTEFCGLRHLWLHAGLLSPVVGFTSWSMMAARTSTSLSLLQPQEEERTQKKHICTIRIFFGTHTLYCCVANIPESRIASHGHTQLKGTLGSFSEEEGKKRCWETAVFPAGSTVLTPEEGSAVLSCPVTCSSCLIVRYIIQCMVQ